jgi:hypothetical protein
MMLSLIKQTLLLVFIGLIFGCNKENINSGNTSNIGIGKNYQGGIIFYIDSTKSHGLIAAISDQSDGIAWFSDTVRTDALDKTMGAGKTNTKKIISILGQGNYAAKLCDELVLNGYDDWYLPSYDELNELYIQQNKVGGFISGYYWTSTDLGAIPPSIPYYAMNIGFPSVGGKFNVNMYKVSLNRVRAIRSF